MSYTLHTGDCLDVLPTLPADSIDTCITDPPYGLAFMGKDWDHGVPGVRFWQEVCRVLKPGAMLLAFGGTRTHHRLMVAIEDAGFEIRDCLMWLYGSGFPKSHSISKAIDKAAGAERVDLGRSPNWREAKRSNGQSMNPMPNESRITAPATPDAQRWHGYGTALKPAWEPIIVAMKPLEGTFAENALAHGTAGLWIDGGRIPSEVEQETFSNGAGPRYKGVLNGGKVSDSEPRVTSATPSGRWPANVVLDEVAAGMLDEQSGASSSTGGTNLTDTSASYSGFMGGHQPFHYGDTGGASRFFYCAKASRRERNLGLDGLPERLRHTLSDYDAKPSEGRTAPKATGGPQRNHHPTVKPLDLMRWLCRLTKTPAGGVVLDPFMGSGSTGMAAVLEGRDFIGIELDEDYCEIARRRIDHAARTPRQLSLLEALL